MSVAWYIVLESKIPGLDDQVNGKALAHAADRLEAAAQQTGVQSLLRFFSASPEELSAFAEAENIGLDPDAVKLPSENWFSAAEGLKTVESLLALVTSIDIENSGQIAIDLNEFRRILCSARDHGIRWHLAVDY
jgi:hypothetical protein